MSLFGKLDLESMIEKALEHIDMEEVTAQVMGGLKITDLDIFFVVCKPKGSDDYEFIGMTYTIESARELLDTAVMGVSAEILKLNMMKMIPLAKQMGYVEPVL